MTGVSKALARIAPSATLVMTARVAALKAAGGDVIGLSAGEPDFDMPDHIKDAVIDALRENKTRYTNVDGTPELKAAIVEKFRRDNTLVYQPNQVTVNAGGKHTLFNALLATIGAGDEVIIPSPYWVSYPDIVAFAGAKSVFIEASADQHYKITPAQLNAAITDKTRWVILNSPSNPSGAAYSADELRALGEVLLKRPQIMILTDDMYEHIWYAGFPFATMAEVVPELYDHTLTMNGCSKAYSMTGLRIGFAGGPEWLIKAIATLQSQSTSNPCSLSQAAALEALTGPQEFLEERVRAFRKRRDLVVGMLNDAPGLNCPVPDGAFYVYPDARALIGKKTPDGKVIKSDEALTDYFLDSVGVAAVHGGAFGLSPAFRISYATSDALLQDACERIQRACAALS